MNMKKITKEVFKADFEQFLALYKYNVVNRELSATLDDIRQFGIIPVPSSTSSIKKMKIPMLADSTIIFFSNKGKPDINEFFRHLKNLCSHSENIKIFEKGGIEYYRIHDFRPLKDRKRKDTMKGIVPVKIWREFAQNVEQLIIKES